MKDAECYRSRIRHLKYIRCVKYVIYDPLKHTVTSCDDVLSENTILKKYLSFNTTLLMKKTIIQVKVYNEDMLMINTSSRGNLSLDIPLHGLHPDGA